LSPRSATPDAVPLGELSRVLVIKLAHLGDVLLASPVISVLKRYAPGLEVDALVYSATAPMLSGHPDLSRLFTIDRDWNRLGFLARLGAEARLLRALRERAYDLVVALSDKPRVAWLMRLTGARYGVTHERPTRPALWQRSFTHFVPRPRGNSRHTVEAHLDTLRRIGLWPEADERRLTLVPGADAEHRADALLQEHGLTRGGFIHIHPASRWQFKCWPAARIAALINLLHARGDKVVLTGAPDANEAPLIEEVVSGLDKPATNLAGQLSLKELAAVIGRARLFVGVDSVPMHIAAAMQTPTVALFGPSGEIEWAPWQVPHRILVSDHPCRPCGVNGCGGSNRSECMEVIPVNRVLAAIDELGASPARATDSG
jgi:heptosyltransferase-3